MALDALNDAVTKGAATLGELPDGLEVEEREPARPSKQQTQATPAAETGGDPEEDGEQEQEVTAAEEDADELTEEEISNSKQLFKALKNPRTAGATLEFLAKQLGVELNVETKKEGKETVKSLMEELREAAPGLEFVTDKIAPVLEALINKRVSEAQEDLQTSIENDRVERANKELQADSKRAFTSVAKQFNYKDNLIPDNILNKMTSLMKEIQPSPTLTPLKYVTILHDAARAELKLTAKPESTPINRGRGASPASRLASERVSPTRSGAEPKTKMSLNQAIAAGIEELGSQLG